MKSFRYKFTALIWVLIALVIVISLAGVGYNIYNLISLIKISDLSGVITTSIILAINVALTAFAISICVFSKYVVKNGYVYNYFGFIRTKISASEIVQFTHFKKSDKLVAYFNDQRYSVIVICASDYEKFVLAVRELNSNIAFTSEIDGEEQP